MSCCFETMRARPVSGLNLSNFGTSAFQLQTQPPATTLLASATAAISTPIGQRDPHQRLREFGQAFAHQGRLGHRAHVEAQRAPQHLRQRVGQRRRQQHHQGAAGRHRGEVAEVARAGDLAFLARLLQPARRGRQVAVLCGLVGHGRWGLNGSSHCSRGASELEPEKRGLGGSVRTVGRTAEMSRSHPPTARSSPPGRLRRPLDGFVAFGWQQWQIGPCLPLVTRRAVRSAASQSSGFGGPWRLGARRCLLRSTVRIRWTEDGTQ